MTTKHNLARLSLAATAATLAAMLASFASQLVIAKLFGATAELDAYLTAGALPLALTGVLTAAVGYITIPILAECRDDPAGLQQTIGHFFACAVGLAAAIAGAGSLLARALVHWTAPQLRADKLALAEHLQPYFWAATGILLITSFLTSLHHFRRRFVLPSLSGALVFACIIAAGSALAPRLGITSLAAGYLAGAVLQCLVLLPVLREDLKFTAAGLWRVGQRFFAAALPVMGSLLPFTLLPVIDAYWAARLPDGSLSYLGYASRIVLAAAAASAHGVGTVLFPHIAQDAAQRDFEMMRRRIANTLQFVLAVLMPVACLLAAFRVPVVTLLFERGHFTAQATAGLAAVLPFYLLGMLGMAGMGIVSRGFYSVRRSGSLAVIGLASLAGYAVLSGLLSPLYSYVGIGMAYAIYWTVQFAVATAWLGRETGGLWRREGLRFLLKIAVASLVAVGLLASVETQILKALGRLAGLLTLGIAAFALLLLTARLVLNAQEIAFLTSVIDKGARR